MRVGDRVELASHPGSLPADEQPAYEEAQCLHRARRFEAQPGIAVAEGVFLGWRRLAKAWLGAIFPELAPRPYK
jgi:hypothetical protein